MDALMDNDLDTKLYTQAANSPDVNLLDLGFFRVIQSFNDSTLTEFQSKRTLSNPNPNGWKTRYKP